MLQYAFRAALFIAALFAASSFLAVLAPAAEVAACPAGRQFCNSDERRAFFACTDWAEGAIWFNNSGNEPTSLGYYKIGVTVAHDAANVTVFIRGSVYNCEETSSRTLFAVDVRSAEPNSGRLWVPPGSVLNRGTAPGLRYHWTSQGNSVSATLNVSGLASSTEEDTGFQTIFIGVHRCFSTNGTSATGSCAVTSVPVEITRAKKPAVYDLKPAMSSLPKAIEPGQPLSVTGSVSKTGNRQSSFPTDTRYTRIVYKKGQSAPDNTGGGDSHISGCQFYGMTGANTPRCTQSGSAMGPVHNDYVFTGSGSTVGTLNDTAPEDFSPGDKICYGLSVSGFNEINGPSKTSTRHSPLVCVTVGKKPKVHVIGGDLYVGRGSSASSYVTTSVTRGPVSGGLDPAIYYGSWSEYGIAATGTITRMGSAASYANGTEIIDMCKLSLLSLSNRSATNTCIASAIGRYPLPSVGRSIVDKYAGGTKIPLASASVIPASLTSGVYRPVNTSAITLNGGSLPAGRSVIIYAPNNDVVIAGNLTYSNGSLTSTGSVPQLVIIARNITINDNVSQVDAWLVAKTASHGNIYTCNQPRTSLKSDVCANKLTVNGPVISNKLHMLRTAGAGAGVDALAPAEVFNLRPDAYLWGASQPGNTTRVPTADLIELPPRF